MIDKKDFNKKSDQLIKSFEEQKEALNNYLEKLEKEYQQKFDREKDTEESRNKDDKNEK